MTSSVEKPAIVFNNQRQFRFVSFNMPQSDRDPVIFAKDLGDYNKVLMDYYPDRHVYMVFDQMHPYWIKKIR
jgi:hypothetical protein